MNVDVRCLQTHGVINKKLLLEMERIIIIIIILC